MPREQEIKQKYFNYAWIQVDLSNFELHQITWMWIHVALLYTLLKAKTFYVIFLCKSIDFLFVFILSLIPSFLQFLTCLHLLYLDTSYCRLYKTETAATLASLVYLPKIRHFTHVTQQFTKSKCSPRVTEFKIPSSFHLPRKTFSDHIYHIRQTQYILHFVNCIY